MAFVNYNCVQSLNVGDTIALNSNLFLQGNSTNSGILVTAIPSSTYIGVGYVRIYSTDNKITEIYVGNSQPTADNQSSKVVRNYGDGTSVQEYKVIFPLSKGLFADFSAYSSTEQSFVSFNGVADDEAYPV